MLVQATHVFSGPFHSTFWCIFFKAAYSPTCSWPTPHDKRLHQPLLAFNTAELGRLGGSVSWASDFGSGHAWSPSLWVQAPRLALCWQFRAWRLLQILCLPLSALPPPMLCLSLSRINIKKKLKIQQSLFHCVHKLVRHCLCSHFLSEFQHLLVTLCEAPS